ncbi:MAG: hypothetical protein KAJ62_11585 [Desulfobacteraceae bacterium]|nr:hypothetical protein [Desulfobacteraceae bacterium]
MKKLLEILFVTLLAIVCVGCIARKPIVTFETQNIFSSTQPRLKLLIDKNLKYSGEFKIATKMKGYKFNQEYYVFNEGNEILTIIIMKKIPIGSDYHWLPIKIKKGEDGVLIDQGTTKLAGKQWKTCVQVLYFNSEQQDAFYSKNIDIDQHYLSKTYVRNFSEDTQVQVLYLETLKSYEEDIKQYVRLKTFTSEQAAMINDFLIKAEESIIFSQ